MHSPNNTFYGAFELDTSKEPPLYFTLVNGGVGHAVRQPMSGDVLSYTQPNLGVPGAGQTSRGKELEEVANALAGVLEKKGVRTCTLKPAEEPGVSIAPDGHTEAFVPASMEVLLFIATALNERLKSAGQTA